MCPVVSIVNFAAKGDLIGGELSSCDPVRLSGDSGDPEVSGYWRRGGKKWLDVIKITSIVRL